jgi:tetratricopeptide (TPR) repeat protein
MFKPRKVFTLIFLLIVSVLLLGTARIFAQAETEEEKQDRLYREDYDRVQKVVKVADPLKRADQLVAFIKERPDSKLMQYAEESYLAILDSLGKQGNNPPLLALSERLINLRPKFGETYYFYALALKNNSKFPESMDALAKCYVLKNKLSQRAESALQLMYKARNQGSLAGLDKIIKKAQVDVEK